MDLDQAREHLKRVRSPSHEMSSPSPSLERVKLPSRLLEMKSPVFFARLREEVEHIHCHPNEYSGQNSLNGSAGWLHLAGERLVWAMKRGAMTDVDSLPLWTAVESAFNSSHPKMEFLNAYVAFVRVCDPTTPKLGEQFSPTQFFKAGLPLLNRMLERGAAGHPTPSPRSAAGGDLVKIENCLPRMMHLIDKKGGKAERQCRTLIDKWRRNGKLSEVKAGYLDEYEFEQCLQLETRGQPSAGTSLKTESETLDRAELKKIRQKKERMGKLRN